MASIKVNRALQQAAIGSCNGSALTMLSYVPDSVRTALTGRELGQLIDSLWTACQEAKTIAAADAINDGAIWDARGQRFVPIAA